MPKGTLYVIATPIGNLEDLGQRAVSVLGEVNLIVCEDTRHTRKLLSRHQIQRPLDAYHNFNEAVKAEVLLDRLGSGQSLALVSDAGTPTISDPGYRLVRLCHQQDIPVIPIPGPCAAVAALSVSGLPTDGFRFVGFLPARKEARRRALEGFKTVTCTLIFYEAPRRLRTTLEDMKAILGDREAFVGREMTKLHEDYDFARLSDLAVRVREQGEAVIVVRGAEKDEPVPDAVDLNSVSRQELLKIAAFRLGVTRHQLYDALYRK